MAAWGMLRIYAKVDQPFQPHFYHKQQQLQSAPLRGLNYSADPSVVHQLNVVCAGVSAGFTGTLFGHPLDLIKGIPVMQLYI